MKNLLPRLAAQAVFSLTLTSVALADPLPGETEITFTPNTGEAVIAYEGRVSVPEHRADRQSRTIELAYVRFPATGEGEGAPIVYLAGGPGGSGISTARGNRFPLFMAMREHGDVIAFDQRGTGASTALPPCRSSVALDPRQRFSEAELTGAYRQAADECRAYWEGEGIAFAGYTTAESVADLSALRAHLGAEQMTLWGISYGSHLALAAIDAIPSELDRVMLASVEGLNQTVKLPAQTDAFFDRVQAALETQPAVAAAYPDLAGLMHRVHARLEAEPLLLEWDAGEGRTGGLLLDRLAAQRLAGAMISDPSRLPVLLAIYAELDAGGSVMTTGLVRRFVSGDPNISFRAMPLAMDVASGISPDRLASVMAQAETSLLGLGLNFPMPQLNALWADMDLGPEFRDGPFGDTPVLTLTGTLDGRTYPESQQEAVSGLTNVSRVTIVNAGHNLFMSTPEVTEIMHRFMRGEAGLPEEIIIPLPDFTRNPFQ
ncbi:alpha/beta fold hydrolase [Hyphobacterium sp.]|uniref:alpha/beta fold hydrolase n=1 Tax=Hyphobacterium sp. TaxID=2004662 RepID=UPI003BA9C47B